MNRSNRILITGGSGFIGGHLIEYLKKKGNRDIVVFDKLMPVDKTPAFYKGNVLSNNDIRGVFKKFGPFHTVYHLASEMPNKAVSDEITWETNVLGARYLATESVKHGTRSLVFTSSNVSYGIPDGLPTTEETPLLPLEVYGKSKAQAERELEKFKNTIHLQIFRSPVVIGIGRLGLLGILFEFISENRNIYVLGDGSNKYQFVDVTDLCDALERASHKTGFDIYTIGSDGVLPLRELFQRVISFAHSNSRIISLPRGPSLLTLWILDKLNISPLGPYQYTMISRSLYADTSKAKKKLGWTPQKTNTDSFIDSYKWYVKNKNDLKQIGSDLSANRSLPKMKIFKLLKLLS